MLPFWLFPFATPFLRALLPFSVAGGLELPLFKGLEGAPLLLEPGGGFFLLLILLLTLDRSLLLLSRLEIDFLLLGACLLDLLDLVDDEVVDSVGEGEEFRLLVGGIK